MRCFKILSVVGRVYCIVEYCKFDLFFVVPAAQKQLQTYPFLSFFFTPYCTILYGILYYTDDRNHSNISKRLHINGTYGMCMLSVCCSSMLRRTAHAISVHINMGNKIQEGKGKKRKNPQQLWIFVLLRYPY